jgi:hypothetical protein
MTKAKKGDVVRFTSKVRTLDMTYNKLYLVTRVIANYATVMDDAGDEHDIDNYDYEVVGTLQDMVLARPALKDVMGCDLSVGDTIVYPVSSDRMEFLRIRSINPTALTAICGYVGGPVGSKIAGTITVGCLDKRAIKIERS